MFAKLSESGVEAVPGKELFIQVDDHGIQVEITPEQYKDEVDAIPDIPEIQVTEEALDVKTANNKKTHKCFLILRKIENAMCVWAWEAV